MIRPICLTRSSQAVNALPISLIVLLPPADAAHFANLPVNFSNDGPARSSCGVSTFRMLAKPLKTLTRPVMNPGRLARKMPPRPLMKPLNTLESRNGCRILWNESCSAAVFRFVSRASVGSRSRIVWIPSLASLKKSARPGAVAFFHAAWNLTRLPESFATPGLALAIASS